MTTYTLNPNETRLAVYTLNTGTMPTNNVAFSHITADITNNSTSITVKTGEGSLFAGGMIATLEQLTPDGKKATAREVVLINGISDDTLTITRGYENCVIDDTATPKVLGNTPQAFTSGARLSVYVSRALLNGAQTRLAQVNCPCNTSVYNQEMAITACIANNCDIWRDALYQAKARCRYNDCGFGDGSDGDCIIDEDTFLCANCDYNFKNLTICEGVLVRFEGQGTPRINVQRKFCNMGTIDLRGGTFVGACSKCDGLTGCSVGNNACQTCYNAMCYGCAGGAGAGSAGYENACPGCNATEGAGGDGGCGGTGRGYTVRWCGKPICDYCGVWEPQPGGAGSPASGYNGGNGGNGGSGYGDSYAGLSAYGCTAAGGGGGGGYYTGNGGNGGSGGTAYARSYHTAGGGHGGNGGIWGKGGDGGCGGPKGQNCYVDYSCGVGGNGGNGYIGGKGGNSPTVNSHRSGNAGHGGKGVVEGGAGGDIVEDAYMIQNPTYRAGNGGEAINNMYGLIVHACEFYNYCIMAKGGDGGRGGNAPWGLRVSSSTGGNEGGIGGCGACGANGGHVSIAYIKLLQGGTVNTLKGCGGKGGSNNCCAYVCNGSWHGCTTYQPDGADGNDGRCIICKPF